MNIPIAKTRRVILTASEPARRVANEKDNAEAVQQIAVSTPAISPKCPICVGLLNGSKSNDSYSEIILFVNKCSVLKRLLCFSDFSKSLWLNPEGSFHSIFGTLIYFIQIF